MSLSLSFPICEMGSTILPTSQLSWVEKMSRCGKDPSTSLSSGKTPCGPGAGNGPVGVKGRYKSTRWSAREPGVLWAGQGYRCHGSAGWQAHVWVLVLKHEPLRVRVTCPRYSRGRVASSCS